MQSTGLGEFREEQKRKELMAIANDEVGNINSFAMESGIIFGTGEVLGGILFAFMGHLTIKYGRDPIVVLGFVVSLVAYFLIFINIVFLCLFLPTFLPLSHYQPPPQSKCF